MKRIALSVAALLAMTAWVAIAETKEDDVIGVWFTENEGSKVEIKKEGGTFIGEIVWLKDPNYTHPDDEAGKPKRDRNNPDSAKQKEPIVGLDLLKGFTWDGEAWSGGTIYNPEDGKTYKCTMKLTAPDVLDVRGYVGIQAFGKSQTWKRAPKEEKAAEGTSAPAQGTARKKQEGTP